MIDEYLWYRSIILNKEELKFIVGVTQELCLGETFWLVVIDTVLKQLTEVEAWVVQVFADDTFVVAR